jgi:transposase-like protein
MTCGNVSAIATYLTQSGKRRIFRCRTCATHFAETRETVFFDLRTSEEKVMMALKMLLVRVDLAGICFVLGVTEETVLAWLRRAAQQAEAINHHLLRHLPVTQVQLDEMWNFIERKHARETDEAGESLPEGEEGRQGVWSSFARGLMIAAVVGPRTLDTAKGRGNHEARRGHPGVLQRWSRASGCPHCCVPRRRLRALRGPPAQARLCAPSGSGLRATGHTAATGEAADAQHTRRTGSRTPDATRLHDQHGLGRTREPDLAAGLGTVGAEDGQLL